MLETRDGYVFSCLPIPGQDISVYKGARAVAATPTLLFEADMRNRALLLTALMIAPAALSAQVRLPRGTRGGGPPTAAPLPPEVPVVAKALAYKRSRWSGEAYTLINTFQVPDGAGMTTYTSFGSGTRADYRYSDHFSATVDMTASVLGSPAISESAELGTRFRPGSLDQRLRTYVDARAQFVHLYDTPYLPSSTGAIVGGFDQSAQVATGQRYSRGFGGVAGAGFEFSFTNSFALTSELLATRDRMSMYRFTNPTNIPLASHYWMTSFRYTIGFKYNATRALNLAQNPLR